MSALKSIPQILGQETISGIAEKARVDPEDDATSSSLMSRPKLGTSARRNAAGIGHSGDEMCDDEKRNDA
jgi:hypothetical protein